VASTPLGMRLGDGILMADGMANANPIDTDDSNSDGHNSSGHMACIKTLRTPPSSKNDKALETLRD
jgi:hypothetical protein